MVKIRSILNITTYACALTGYAAVLRHVKPVSALLFAALLPFAVTVDYRRAVHLPAPIPRWLLNGLAVGLLVFFFSGIRATYIIEPVLNTLLFLVAIKLFEEKRSRDYLQILMLCMLLLVGSSLLSLSAIFLLYFSLLVTLSTFSLVLLAYFSQAEDLAITGENVLKLARYALLICGITVPLTIVFFVLLPRTSYPLLNFLKNREISRTGFTDTVSLGMVSELQESNQVVLRAEMPRMEEPDLYWRGIVLDTFDGSTWSVGTFFKTETPAQSAAGTLEGVPTHQTVYLEPYGNRYLFALDKPVHVLAAGVREARARTYTLRGPPESRMKYEAVSIPSAFLPEASLEASRYLQLPPDFSPRIRELVQNFRGAGGGEAWVGTLQQLFTGGSYHYSLERLPLSESPLEDFLFVQKRGNCEYFASAMAAMLRAGGLPSRVVGGYKGGYYNRAGGYYLVLQSNAHVWVEAYLKNGWLRIDPTPPLREGTPSALSRGPAIELKVALDTVTYYWNRLVITYDLRKQAALLETLRSTFQTSRFPWLPFPSTRSAQLYLLLPLIFLCAGFVFHRFLARRRNPLQRIADRFLKKMAAHGYEKEKSEGLEEFVARIDDEVLREKAGRFVEDFEAIYYRDEEWTGPALSRLRNLLSEL